MGRAPLVRRNTPILVATVRTGHSRTGDEMTENKPSIMLRPSRRPWWLWLLGLLAALLVAALIWTLLNNNNRGATATASPGATAAQSLGASGAPQGSLGASPAVSDINQIIGATDAQSLAGNRAELTGVTVLSVVADKVFWIGATEDQRVLVVVEEDESGGSVEGGVDISEGQTVDLSGVVRKMPSANEAMERWGLSEAEATTLKDEAVFIRAQRVQVQ